MSESRRRIAEALHTAVRWGGTDGSHHKQWVIDQMVRALTGCPVVRELPNGFRELGESDEYRWFVANAKTGDDGPDTYEWDEGIPP